MCSLLQENLLGEKKESVSRSYVHVCWKKILKMKILKMKHFNKEIYTGCIRFSSTLRGSNLATIEFD